MRVSRIALLAATALLAGAPAAEAQTIPSPIRYLDQTQGLGGFSGWLFPNSRIHVNDTTAFDLGPQSAPVFGARYQMRFSGPLSGHVALGYTPSERNLWVMGVGEDPAAVTPLFTGEQVPANLLLFDAGLHFGLTGPRTWHGLAPYVTGTAGLVTDLSGPSDVELRAPVNERWEPGPSFALGAAIGTDFFPVERVSLRLELSNRLWRVAAPAGFTGRASAPSEWNSVPGVTFGAAVHF
jgi:hypothetical protein